MQLETQLRQELDSQSRLASIYKDASQDGEKRVQELTSAVSELQGLLKTANDGEYFAFTLLLPIVSITTIIY